MLPSKFNLRYLKSIKIESNHSLLNNTTVPQHRQISGLLTSNKGTRYSCGTVTPAFDCYTSPSFFFIFLNTSVKKAVVKCHLPYYPSLTKTTRQYSTICFVWKAKYDKGIVLSNMIMMIMLKTLCKIYSLVCFLTQKIVLKTSNRCKSLGGWEIFGKKIFILIWIKQRSS